ncbi:MAG: hypothetical protein HY376_01990 [Candidatus Blackburnbacteria bacterium]|nr:hypothetical protein [Candidatus Blackburnbacteria bacterium]
MSQTVKELIDALKAHDVLVANYFTKEHAEACANRKITNSEWKAFIKEEEELLDLANQTSECFDAIVRDVFREE